MKLPTSAIATIERIRLGFVATVSAKGRPNVSPKGTFIVVDDSTIAFGEIRSPQTITNLRTNPECEINFVDPFTRKGVRLRGRADILTKDTTDFATLFPTFQSLWGTLADRINVIVRIPADDVRPLSTPPYDDGATEAEMIALYKAKYAKMYP